MWTGPLQTGSHRHDSVYTRFNVSESASQRDTCLNLKGSLLQGLALLAREFGLGEWGKWKDSRGRLQLVQKAIQMQMVAGGSKEFLTVKQLPKGNGMSGKLCPSQHHKI